MYLQNVSLSITGPVNRLPRNWSNSTVEIPADPATSCCQSMGGATGGCGGQCPHFWDHRGTGGRGEGRSNENDLCFYSKQSLFNSVQMTEFQLPWLIFACFYPTFGKVGYIFFAHSARESCFVPHLKIRGAAHVSITRQYCNIFCVLCIRPKSDLCWCQLVHTPVSSAVEVENASILDTDVTAVFTAETAPTKSAVCIYTLICNYLWLINAPTYWNPRILHTGRLVSSRWTDEWMSFLRDKVISNVSADTAPRFNNSSRLNHPRP